MLILGIDPGTAILGYAVLEAESNRYRALTYDVIVSEQELALPERLGRIFSGLSQVIDQYRPEEAAIEQLFFNRNTRTALSVGEARGVAILAAQLKGVAVFEYTPLQVKQAVVGYGRAEKKQVQEMVRMLLNLPAIPRPDDAADALAVAICHAGSSRYLKLTGGKCR
jgi:crossover junction endodeoxyribonuclease RuvC